MTDRGRRVLWIVIACGLLAYAAVDVAKFQEAMGERKPTLKRWLPQAAEVGQDARLYERHPDYLYPPFFLVVLKPLTRVSPATAAVIWQLAKYASIVAIFASAWGVLSRAGPLPDWVRLATIIVAFRFVHSDLRHGNVNLFIAALVTGAAWLFVTNRRFAAGAAVGLAACVKVTPALWLAYLAYKREWRGLVGAAIAIVFALEVIPGAVVGWSLNHELLQAWFSHCIRSFAEEGRIDSVGMNQSLTAVTNRMFGWSGLSADEHRVVLVQLADSTIRWIQRGAAILLLAVAGWSCRGLLGQKGSALVFAVEWSLIAPVTLALSGYTWTGHFCLLVLPLTTLFTFLASSRSDGPAVARWVALAGTVAACTIFVFATDVLTSRIREWATQIGLPLLGAMCVLGALVAVRASLRGAGRANGGSSIAST